MEQPLKQELKYSAGWTVLLTLLFVLCNWKAKLSPEMAIALPFFAMLYFLMFSLGRDSVSAALAHWIGSDVRRTLALPATLVISYFGYALLNSQNPFQGPLLLLPYFVAFPALTFLAAGRKQRKIDWLDFTVFTVFLLPTTLIAVHPVGNLPFHGEGFDSVYRIVIILTAVYSFVAVRGLSDVGFFPVLNWKHLFTALWVWLLFTALAFMVGYCIQFVKVGAHQAISVALIHHIALALIASFLHTALFEELFFRGILQNMLAQRIQQAKSWVLFWGWGIGLLMPLSLLVGYSLKGGMNWFPALISCLLFAGAFLVEKQGKAQAGKYTALATTSVLFGLVHYHAGSIVFVGLASLGGWAYGYTYLRTKNIFYCALVHALVGTSVLIFGLQLVK
jgi:uncharacterized protein